MLDTLNEYAQLIDLVLFATIIIAIVGWLFYFSQKYEQIVKEKYEVKLASKDREISILRERLTSKDENHRNEIAVLQHRITHFDRIMSASCSTTTILTH